MVAALNLATVYLFLAFWLFQILYQYWSIFFGCFQYRFYSFYQLGKLFVYFLLVAVKISCPLRARVNKSIILKMVLCYLNFIQPYCVLRYLVSHTSSDCTSVSVALNPSEYRSTTNSASVNGWINSYARSKRKTANDQKPLQLRALLTASINS